MSGDLMEFSNLSVVLVSALVAAVGGAVSFIAKSKRSAASYEALKAEYEALSRKTSDTDGAPAMQGAPGRYRAQRHDAKRPPRRLSATSAARRGPASET